MVSSFIFIGITILAFIYGFLSASLHISVAVVIGNMLSFVNIIAGFLLLKKFFHADKNLFLKAFFGGMMVRMVITLLFFVILIGYTKINKISFTVSLVISYILYSVIEMYFINKNLKAET